ncbi:hypothetical protein JG687_00019412 [Phytophthora cactorum]|uniref:Uncharacterized protein n=1 Tax=Phytophthora cactorum TaxID=29920 RepID=A0A329RFS7_9STRA|nr:hypothetical protein Pcac1_g28572 [Phytophthora cactorum]KAG2790580.1 hypothetical protein Pcac1_g620 [Phytophthora cactorum]KAG2796546.1 hypothetical protein PC111_g21675 [Phytophthora cactorum]KAG2875793.1 hypothetical protein PC114_g24526 [Phytophthora cactorum]KAG2882798.1 hypothetical protein PC115_g21850 [Phytophthora cactorum]
MNFTAINAIIVSEAASMAPRRMTIREGCDLIAATVDEANPGSSLLKHRLMYHIRGNDMDACIINASIEFLQFGLMPEEKTTGAIPGFERTGHPKRDLETRGLDYK